MDEKRAIELCLRHRDPAGFEALVKQYRREAYFHALALMGNDADAADACQESFTRAFAAIPRLQELTAFYPWFYRILRNCCLNMLSRRKTAQDYAAKQQEEGGSPREAESPADLIARREEQAEVWRALQKLAVADREILSLKYLQGKRYAQIAECLGIPEGTVMSRLFYARKAFREVFLGITQPEGIAHE